MRAPSLSETYIANLALAEVPDKPITSFTDGSLQARECARNYAQCVAELLEDHPWTFALGRAPLALLTNDRPVWAYAYASPNDAAYLGKIFAPMDGGALNGAPVIPGYCAPALSRWPAEGLGQNDWHDREPGWRYEHGVDDQTIYTDCPNAVVEYTKNAVSEAVFRPMFVRALALSLATRIAIPLTKDSSRRKELATMAEMMAQRAKASDRNREREVWGDFTPDWIAVR